MPIWCISRDQVVRSCCLAIKLCSGYFRTVIDIEEVLDQAEQLGTNSGESNIKSECEAQPPSLKRNFQGSTANSTKIIWSKVETAISLHWCRQGWCIQFLLLYLLQEYIMQAYGNWWCHASTTLREQDTRKWLRGKGPSRKKVGNWHLLDQYFIFNEINSALCCFCQIEHAEVKMCILLAQPKVLLSLADIEFMAHNYSAPYNLTQLQWVVMLIHLNIGFPQPIL